MSDRNESTKKFRLESCSGWNGSCMPTPARRQSKTLILSMNVDKKSLGTEFLIAICHPTGYKSQLKTLFLVIFIHVLSTFVD